MLFLRSRTIGGQILRQIGDHVAGDGDGAGRPREAGRRGGVDTRRVIHKIGVEARRPDVLLGQISGQLVYDGTHHLQMPQLLCAQRSIGNVPKYQI